MKYLKKKLLFRWKHRIIKCYTNHMLFFYHSTASCAEDSHAKLKRVLRIFIDDLRQIVQIIELLLKHERTKYFIAHEKAKSRVSKNYAIDTLKNLQLYVSSYALWLIFKQLKKFEKTMILFTTFSLCTKIYEKIMGLPCIQRRWRKSRERKLRLEDVHSHWRIHGIDRTRNMRHINEIRMRKTKMAEMKKNQEREKIREMQRAKNTQNMKMKNDSSQKKTNQTLNVETLLSFPWMKNRKKSPQLTNDVESSKDFSLDFMLAIKTSKKTKNKNRSTESLNKIKNTSTRRDSSKFEHMKAEFSQRISQNNFSESVSMNIPLKNERGRDRLRNATRRERKRKRTKNQKS